MSIEAINWALNDAPDVPPQLVAVLIGLANHAGPDGRNAFASQARLARYGRKSDRAVRNDLKELLRLKLIRISENQGAAAHIRADVRPVVYDLALEKTSGSTVPGGSELPDAPGSGVPTGSTVPAVNGGELGQEGSTPGTTVPPGSRVPPGSTASNARKHTSDKPTTNQRQKKTSSSSLSTPSRKRSGRDDDDQAETEPDPETAARVETAKKIVEWWWDQLSPKPAGGSRAFFASRREVEKLLAVGWAAKEIAAAARAIGSPITVPRMEIELNRTRRASTDGSPSGHLVTVGSTPVSTLTSTGRQSPTARSVAEAQAAGEEAKRMLAAMQADGRAPFTQFGGSA